MRPTFVLLASATPALAHTGAHLHPHDGGGWLAVAGALAVIGLAALIGMRR